MLRRRRIQRLRREALTAYVHGYATATENSWSRTNTDADRGDWRQVAEIAGVVARQEREPNARPFDTTFLPLDVWVRVLAAWEMNA